jgi:diacylglycerol kinase family enzyme
VSEAQLCELLGRHGHTVAEAVSTSDDPRRLAAAAGDVVVVAGGDGTVSTAARVLARQHRPMALLPMGTANNIARSLGVHGTRDEVIDRWATASRRPFDLGRATGPWGERWFLEAVGGGLVAHSIRAFECHRRESNRPQHDELLDAVRMHVEVLSRLEPCHWEMTLDGAPLSGEYLLVAVLNIPNIGPNLEFCPHTDPSDGWFSVVMVGEEHRPALERLLNSRAEAREAWVGLECRRATRVEMSRGDRLHIDDAVFDWPAAARVSIHVEPGALDVLV